MIGTEGDVIGYKSPPRSTRYPTGVAEIQKVGLKRKGEESWFYVKILDRMVTINMMASGRARHHLRRSLRRGTAGGKALCSTFVKKALDGNKPRRPPLEEIQLLRRERCARTLSPKNRPARSSELPLVAMKHPPEESGAAHLGKIVLRGRVKLPQRSWATNRTMSSAGAFVTGKQPERVVSLDLVEKAQ